MRLHRFYSPEMIEPQAVGTVTRYAGADQWRKVFRFTTGDKVILFDGSGFDFLCEIEGYGANNSNSFAEVKVVEVLNNVVAPLRETSLFCAVLKKDTFEWVVEKATEMGVSRIVPVLAERSEKKNLNIERLRKIIIEASEQSGRATLPELGDIISFEEAVGIAEADAKKGTKSIVMDPTGKIFTHDSVKEKSVTLWIGPEGGWSPSELATFKEKEGKGEVAVFSMGSQILRAETAVIAGLASVLLK